MTPQELVAALSAMGEAQGRQLLRAQLPHFSEAALNRLVALLKKEADQSWYSDAQRSLVFSGHLLLIGDLTRHTYYHAIGLMARGDALRRMNRNQEALPFFDAAGEEFLSLNDEVDWARTRFGRVSACLGLNRTTEALRDAEEAHKIFLRHGKLLRAGQIDVNAAIINFESGHYDQALHLFDRAIDTYTQSGKQVELYIARAQGNKALTLAAQGKFDEAIALHEQVRATFERYGPREEISVAREDLNIADIYEARGHYSEALHLYNRSRDLFLQQQMVTAAYEVALQMCLCLVRLNRAREAYELANETITFFRKESGYQAHLARVLMHKAEATTQLGNVQEAAMLLREATTLLEEGGYERLAARARLQRAELSFLQHKIDASEREVEYAAEAFAEQEDLPHLAQAMLLQSYIAAAREKFEVAQDLCTQVLDTALGQELLPLQYRCYDFLGVLAEQHDDLSQAAEHYNDAIRCLDELQSRLVLDERSSFLENKADTYQRAILLAWRRGFLEQAFTFVEKAKSRALSDYLLHNIDIRVRFDDPVSDDIVAKLYKAREEQAYFSSIVHQTEDDIHLSDSAKLRVHAVAPEMARQEMQKRERQVEQLLEKIYFNSTRRKHERSGNTSADTLYDSVALLRKHITPATLLLEYYMAGPDLYIFQMTSGGISVRVVADAVPQLERLLSLWRTNLDLVGGIANTAQQDQIAASLLGNGLGLLLRLYDLLLRPVADTLRACEHLIVVPYGMLHYLPFHALYDGSQFLVEQVELSYLPAAALLDICRQRGQRVSEYLRRGDVDFANALVMGLSDGGRLSYAVHEAQVVAQQLGVACALNKDASARLLVEAGPRSPLVHIAAHGLFRLDAPNFSYIKLADRQFNTIEAFNLHLANCSLLVLSACETGRSVVGGVDEVIGLGRGFLYAGAASLLPTFWKVDDASSAELMEIFYQVLLRGATKAAALAHAQRLFLTRARQDQQSFRQHPYFWAAFHLIGDPGPLI